MVLFIIPATTQYVKEISGGRFFFQENAKVIPLISSFSISPIYLSGFGETAQ